jgi:hypothetical protein
MNDWRQACEFAVRRAKSKDLGATAARDGILGLPLSIVPNKAASRVYHAAKAERDKYLAILASRKRGRTLNEGTTGHADIDAFFAEMKLIVPAATSPS